MAMLSYAYWRDRFGADRSVIGKQIKINQNIFTIVGVTPPGFNGTPTGGRSAGDLGAYCL